MSLSERQVQDLASPLVGIIAKFYEDPKNEEDFQRWLKQQKNQQTKARDRTGLRHYIPFHSVRTGDRIGDRDIDRSYQNRNSDRDHRSSIVQFRQSPRG